MALEFVRVAAAHEGALAAFFAELVRQGDNQWFHPHPFTAEQARVLAAYAGRDLYCVAVDEGRVAAYGMLRGWDEGYATPSLGIAVAPAFRGQGLGRPFMHYLHAAARLRGAPRVRLKVYPGNTAARRLYESLGYRFQDAGDGQLLGFVDFGRDDQRAGAAA